MNLFVHINIWHVNDGLIMIVFMLENSMFEEDRRWEKKIRANLVFLKLFDDLVENIKELLTLYLHI